MGSVKVRVGDRVPQSHLEPQAELRLHYLGGCWALSGQENARWYVQGLVYFDLDTIHITSALSPLSELAIRTYLVVKELGNVGSTSLCHSSSFWLSKIPSPLYIIVTPSLGEIT